MLQAPKKRKAEEDLRRHAREHDRTTNTDMTRSTRNIQQTGKHLKWKRTSSTSACARVVRLYIARRARSSTNKGLGIRHQGNVQTYLDTLQRGVQWEGGAVDGGSIM